MFHLLPMLPPVISFVVLINVDSVNLSLYFLKGQSFDPLGILTLFSRLLRMKKPGKHRLVILILVLVFVASGLVYRILGYGESFESIHQGIGFPCYDLTLNAEIVQSIINGRFDVYEKQWNGVQLSSTGGFVYPPLTGYLIAPVYLTAKKFGFSRNEIIFDFSPIPFIIL